MLDIIVRNWNDNCRFFHQLYHSVILPIGKGDERAFENEINLPGSKLDTRSIAAADINNDGMLDILVGNYNDNDAASHSNQFIY